MLRAAESGLRLHDVMGSDGRWKLLHVPWTHGLLRFLCNLRRKGLEMR